MEGREEEWSEEGRSEEGDGKGRERWGAQILLRGLKIPDAFLQPFPYLGSHYAPFNLHIHEENKGRIPIYLL